MAKLTTIPLFPTPITLCNFGEDARALNAELIRETFYEMNEKTRELRSGIGVWQSVGGLEKKYASFADLATNIQSVVHTMAPKIGYDEPPGDLSELIRVEELWANVIYKPGGFHIPHIHGSGETLFSGVYYPTSGLKYMGDGNEPIDLFPEEDIEADGKFMASSVPAPGDLMLFDPAAVAKRQVIPDWVKRYPFYGTEYTMTPKQSCLIIFPNYVEHMVAPLAIPDEVRVSISFAVVKVQ